jgi:hypothetical protein
MWQRKRCCVSAWLLARALIMALLLYCRCAAWLTTPARSCPACRQGSWNGTSWIPWPRRYRRLGAVLARDGGRLQRLPSGPLAEACSAPHQQAAGHPLLCPVSRPPSALTYRTLY